MSDNPQQPSGSPGEPESPALPVRRVARPAPEIAGLAEYEGYPAEYPGRGAALGSPPVTALLVRRKWLILAVFVLLSAVSIPLLWLLIVPTYRATAVVQVSPVLDPLVFQSEKTGVLPFYETYVNTQVGMILSPTVLERVLDRQEVRETRWYTTRESSFLGDVSTPFERIRALLTVAPRRGTQLIDVSARCLDPRDAKEIVNVVMAEYKKYNDEVHKASDTNLFETLQRERGQREMEINGLIEMRSNISNQLGTAAPEELRSQLSVQLNSLKAQRDQLSRDLKMVQWQLRQMPGAASKPAGEGREDKADRFYFQDAEWRSADQRLDDARQQLEGASHELGEYHPKIVLLRSQIEHYQALRDKREAELDNQAENALSRGTTMPEGETPSRLVLDHLSQKRQQEIELLDEEIERQSGKVAQAGEIAQEIARFDEQIQQKREIKEAIRKRLEVLEMEGKAPARVRIAAYATLPSKPEPDGRIVFTVMALLGAAILGVGAGYVRTLLDRRIYEASEVQGIYQAPFLGLLPRISSKHLPHELGGQSGTATDADRTGIELATYSRHSLMENMRMVRTSLLERVSQTGEQVVLITSSLPSTGKTSVAVLLARSLAVVGKKVLLVEGDLRRPALAGRLGIECETGLAAMLTGSAPEADAIRSTGLANFDVLMAGKVPDSFDPELLANGVFTECLERWRSRYDFILVDSPPLLPVADAQILAGHVDGTIVVLRSSHDRKKEAAEAFAQLNAVGGRLLGTVLIGGRFGGGGALYGPGYGYYSGYYGYYGSYASPPRGEPADSSGTSS